MIRRKLMLAGAVLAAFALPALAAGVETVPPPPGPPKAIHVPTASEHTLANGLRVIVVRRAGVPLVTMQFMLRSGSETDPDSLPGTASMVADLLTRGTSTRSAPEIAAAAAALGGSLNAGAGWDETDVAMTVTTPEAGKALDLIADVVRHPTFAKAEIERLRKQTLDGLRVTWHRAGAMASMLARRAVFGDGGYGHPSSGTPASVKAITRADLVKLHSTWYRPDNAVLVFAGDIQPTAAYKLAEQAFGDWAKPATALPKVKVAPADSRLPARLAVNLPGSGQASVVVAHRAIARSAPDYYAGLVTNMVLGGSYSARLNEEIRIKRGLSYGAHSGLDTLRDGGWLVSSVQTKNPSAAEVVSLSLAQLHSLVGHPPSAKELTARKATMIGRFGRSLDTTAGLANRIGELAVYDVKLDAVDHYVDKVQAVSANDVVAFAKQHLGDKGTHVVVVGDAKVYAKALKKLWPKVTPVAIDKLDLGRADLGL